MASKPKITLSSLDYERLQTLLEKSTGDFPAAMRWKPSSIAPMCLNPRTCRPTW